LQGNWERYDHDGDGVVNEVTTEQITDLSLFQALLPTPQEVQPKDSGEQQKVQQEEKLFQANCASCHIACLPLNRAEVTIEGAMGQKGTKVDLEEILSKQNDKYWVALYGGAEPARQAFQAMSTDDQEHLVRFLKSLRSPDALTAEEKPC
jgi:mono/diheme cytochrome c family protein